MAKKKAPAKNAAAPKKAAKKAPAAATRATAPAAGTRYFGEPGPGTDSNRKWTAATDSQYYNSPWYVQHKKTVMPFPPTRGAGVMDLANVLAAGDMAAIKKAGQISFHMNGDTGGSTSTKFAHALSIAAAMAKDLTAGHSFFFHLGDVVYNFGEEDYYYEQFYDEFRDYNAPIFAIPGNHDGMVFNAKMKSLEAFVANFCTSKPQKAPNAGGLLRTTMDQPGVYFTLDAPYVSIIGLYSNVIDGGPGVISTQGNKFPNVTDLQTKFLAKELARLKTKRQTDPRAIIVAVHHPPYAGDSKHGGSPLMAKDLDTVFQNAGVYPDAVISGHAHHYERFERNVAGKKIPYIIAGSGGYNMTPMKNPPAQYPADIPGNAELKMINHLDEYGYLSVSVNGTTKELSINFISVAQANGKNGSDGDKVVVKW